MFCHRAVLFLLFFVFFCVGFFFNFCFPFFKKNWKTILPAPSCTVHSLHLVKHYILHFLHTHTSGRVQAAQNWFLLLHMVQSYDRPVGGGPQPTHPYNLMRL